MGKIAVQNNDVAGEVEADLRAALAVAIKEARSAEAALRRQKAGIERLQDQVWAGTDSIEKAEKNVEKAKQNHIDALAESAASGTAAPMASAVATARKGVVEVQEAVDANRAALAKLKRDLPVWDSNARAAEIEVETKISAILVPVSASLVECGEQIASQLAPIREALAALWGEPSPANHDAALAFEEGRRPLKDAMAAVADFLKSTHIVQRAEPDPWASARARLRADANAELPELTPLFSELRCDPGEPALDERHPIPADVIGGVGRGWQHGPPPPDDGKDPRAVADGQKGGQARAQALPPERRKEISIKAAKTRWGE